MKKFICSILLITFYAFNIYCQGAEAKKQEGEPKKKENPFHYVICDDASSIIRNDKVLLAHRDFTFVLKPKVESKDNILFELFIDDPNSSQFYDTKVFFQPEGKETSTFSDIINFYDKDFDIMRFEISAIVEEMKKGTGLEKINGDHVSTVKIVLSILNEETIDNGLIEFEKKLGIKENNNWHIIHTAQLLNHFNKSILFHQETNFLGFTIPFLTLSFKLINGKITPMLKLITFRFIPPPFQIPPGWNCDNSLEEIFRRINAHEKQHQIICRKHTYDSFKFYACLLKPINSESIKSSKQLKEYYSKVGGICRNIYKKASDSAAVEHLELDRKDGKSDAALIHKAFSSPKAIKCFPTYSKDDQGRLKITYSSDKDCDCAKK